MRCQIGASAGIERKGLLHGAFGLVETAYLV